MTKLHHMASRQLELRLLTDLKAKPDAGRAAEVAAEARSDAQRASAQEGASEKDLSVYRQIASNYFGSLRTE